MLRREPTRIELKPDDKEEVREPQIRDNVITCTKVASHLIFSCCAVPAFEGAESSSGDRSKGVSSSQGCFRVSSHRLKSWLTPKFPTQQAGQAFTELFLYGTERQAARVVSASYPFRVDETWQVGSGQDGGQSPP